MKRLKILRRWFARKLGFARLMCLALLVVFAGARLWDPPPIQELRLRTFDMFQLIDPRHKTARPVTIVDIDDKSLAKLGQWPWPRTRIADLIQNLTGNGAVTIGFDVVFSEADRLNPDLVASQMRDLDDATRAKLRELPSNDQILADAIKRSHVVLGETGQPAISSEIDKSLPFTGVATVGEEDAERFLFEFPGLLAQRACHREGRGRPRPVLDQDRARRPDPPRADDHARPGQHHALAQPRDFARRHGNADAAGPDRQDRHQGRAPQGRGDSDRQERPALGALCPPGSLDLRLGS